MRYHQLTSEERYALSTLRKQGFSQAYIARALGRHRSTIGREIHRNARRDGGYRSFTASEMARGRRSRSRRNWHFTDRDWTLVNEKLEELWSPEQISGRLRQLGVLTISHETIYRYVWNDMLRGARCIASCAARASSGANAIAPMTAGDGWPASATSPNARRQPTTVRASAISRAIQ